MTRADRKRIGVIGRRVQEVVDAVQALMVEISREERAVNPSLGLLGAETVSDHLGRAWGGLNCALMDLERSVSHLDQAVAL